MLEIDDCISKFIFFFLTDNWIIFLVFQKVRHGTRIKPTGKTGIIQHWNNLDNKSSCMCPSILFSSSTWLGWRQLSGDKHTTRGRATLQISSTLSCYAKRTLTSAESEAQYAVVSLYQQMDYFIIGLENSIPGNRYNEPGSRLLLLLRVLKTIKRSSKSK